MIHVLSGATLGLFSGGELLVQPSKFSLVQLENPQDVLPGFWFDYSIRPGIGRHADLLQRFLQRFLDGFFCVWKIHQ